jgi:hypothetical protein
VPDVSNLITTPKNNSVQLGWNNPATGCFDEIIIVAHTTSISGTPTGTYTANSLNYTDAANPDFPAGGKVVYNGVFRPQTVTGLTNGQIYYFKAFTRKGSGWSNGVEVTATPDDITILDYAELAILGINTDIGDYHDELIFVMFKDFKPNSTLEFTDNGYERLYANYWGTTEGVIRLRRLNSSLPAGTVVTVRGKGSSFDVLLNGSNDNGNWVVSSIGGGAGFDLNLQDQVWFMQGGYWDASQGQHMGIYTGKILFGWTATGWKPAPGYADTKGSTLFPGSDCSITNVIDTDNRDKVKYTGLTTAETRRHWITRINNFANWTGYSNNTNYDLAVPFDATLTITPSSELNEEWIGDDDRNWSNCRNWGSLRVPTTESVVVIPESVVRPIEITQAGAVCFSLTISEGANLVIKESGTLHVVSLLEIEATGELTQETGEISIEGDFVNNGTFSQTGGKLTLVGNSRQTIHSNATLSLLNLELDNLTEAVFKPDVTVSNSLTMKRGTYLAGKNFVLGTAIGNTGSLIHSGGQFAGTFRRWFASATNTGVSGLLPVGTNNKFRGARIEFTAVPTGGIISAKYDTNLPANYFEYDDITVDGIVLDNLSTEGVWIIEPESGLVPNTYTLSLTAEGLTGAVNPDNIRILKRDNTTDNAANYDGTWSNGSNEGKGFGNWDLWDDGEDSGHFIGPSTADGHANINSSGTSFGMYGHSGQWANAQRSIIKWGNGYKFSIELAVQWRDGNRGISLFNTGGFAPGNEIWNFDISNAGYGSTGWSYYSDIALRFTMHQNGANIDIQIIGKSELSSWADTTNATISGQTLGGFRIYTGVAPDGNGRRNIYFNNLAILGPWESHGTFSYSGGYYTQSGITSFSEFTLAGNSAENPLPIELLYFNASKLFNHVQLQWATASECNNHFFTVERSADLKAWGVVGNVDGAGNSSTINTYSLMDTEIISGTTYYRLKQTDFDGRFKYSEIVSVSNNQIGGKGIELYPNPNNGLLMVAGVTSQAQVTVYDIVGQLVIDTQLQPGHSSVDLRGQPNGVYFVTVIMGEVKTTRKIILSK